jgi:hypothetical protein
MPNANSNSVHNTRDIMWLKRMYYTKQPSSYDVVIKPTAHRSDEVVESVRSEALQHVTEDAQIDIMQSSKKITL